MENPSLLVPIERDDDIFDLPETEMMCSVYNATPNITKELLIHILSGQPIVDLSDGEYIHFLQIDADAKEYASMLLNFPPVSE